MWLRETARPSATAGPSFSFTCEVELVARVLVVGPQVAACTRDAAVLGNKPEHTGDQGEMWNSGLVELVVVASFGDGGSSHCCPPDHFSFQTSALSSSRR